MNWIYVIYFNWIQSVINEIYLEQHIHHGKGQELMSLLKNWSSTTMTNIKCDTHKGDLIIILSMTDGASGNWAEWQMRRWFPELPSSVSNYMVIDN